VNKQNLKSFQPGYVENRGGPRPNSGRKPDEFKIWIKTLVHSPEARLRLGKILRDEPDADQKVTDKGVAVSTRARADTYLNALELAWNYAEGKPDQIHQVKVEFIASFVGEISNILNRGLPHACPHCQNALEVRPAILKELEFLTEMSSAA